MLKIFSSTNVFNELPFDSSLYEDIITEKPTNHFPVKFINKNSGIEVPEGVKGKMPLKYFVQNKIIVYKTEIHLI